MNDDSDNVTYLVPPGKLRCYITGILRNDTPEENVRQRWARSLVEEYGYPKSDIGVEVQVRMGRARKSADLVVFRADAPHTQQEALIVVEAKRSDVKPSDVKDGVDQLMSYMAACSVCRFGMWVGSERQAFERSLEDGHIERIGDIPRFGDAQPHRPKRADLTPAQELKSVFRRCHNYIYANEGLQKADAFHEMLKLIFCKIFDENEGGDELDFSIDPRERVSESGQRRLLEDRLGPLFERVKARYPYIFDRDEGIKLHPPVAAYIVDELQYLSLIDTRTDVKGDAYEELVGENLRGDRGEYFTPRNVCDMTVKMVMSLFSEVDIPQIKVLDCCCGTGGFLVSWINNLRAILQDQEIRRGRARDVVPRVRERLREACQANMYGLDINPFLVRTCQMNLVMHGDGSANVYRVDSVRPVGEWDNVEARANVPYGKADVVLTNPPFGGKAKVDDAHILDRYELRRWEANSPRSSLPAEQLFVEAAMNFVRPGGILAIVLPDGILNNPGLRFIRSWLLKRAKLIASVDLPKNTFASSGGVNNPSVLVLQRFTEEELRLAESGIMPEHYNVFLATPNTAGIDKRGKAIFRRHPDGRVMVDDEGKGVPDDEIGEVAHRFRQWLAG